ncbi:MAG: helix-hairpin-helix domain-containing protein, partial [Aeoliella sp.]
PSLEREARRELTDKAEAHAVEVFARNLRALLLQPPVPGRKVLAIDPGYKNGCKLALLDEQGSLVTLGLIHITGSEEAQKESREKLLALMREHSPSVIAIGNGSACRPTESLVADLLANEMADTDFQYVIVNEAGASVYSASAIGREEFPECEAIDRSAISIGRRLQDPLSELVKIDPASIGVGLYQHDAKATHLRDTLESTVRSCVSFVGVDVNTASAALLKNVAGLNQLVARRILEHRTEQGAFRTRQALHDVKGLGEATFEQAAGFLKVEGGDNPLDSTWVHPESYEAAGRLLAELDIDAGQVGSDGWSETFAAALAAKDRPALATKLKLGEHALAQLIEALERPGRDLRADLPPPVFRRDVVKLDDLTVGMKLRGSVLNVVDFGAFVDVGLTDSGLVHVSQLRNDFVRDPHSVVSVGDQVDCWVTAIDAERRRVALTMIEPGTEKPKPEKHQSRRKPRGKRIEGDTAKPTTGNKSGKPAHARRGKKSTGGRRHTRQEKPRPQTGSFERRAKREVAPITKEMAEGKEAMRSFSDLLQFHNQQGEESGGGDEAPDSKSGNGK